MSASETKAAVREYFDRDATEYLNAYASQTPDARSEIFLERRRLVLESLRDPIGRVLDIGSGPGVFVEALLARGAEIWMVDLSPGMVRRGQEQVVGGPEAPRVHCQVGDIDALPFPAGVFDTVLCIGVLQYLVRPEQAVRELARVIRPGGQVVMSFPNRLSPLNRLHQAAITAARQGRHALRAIGITIGKDASRLTFRDDIPNGSFASPDIETMARQAGLRAEERLSLSLHFPFSLPGFRAPIRAWDRLANRAFRAGWLRTWGRETIIRFKRE